MIVRACLQSGFCCRKGPCGFGESISKNNPQCIHLIENDNLTTSCGKYVEISKDPSSKYSPAFGYGCCMPIGNSIRNAIKENLYDGVEQYIEIDDF